MALIEQLPEHADHVDAADWIEYFIRLVGPRGFHPDTPVADYVVFADPLRHGLPTFAPDVAIELQRRFNYCMKLLEDNGFDVYDVAQEIIERIDREDASREGC